MRPSARFRCQRNAVTPPESPEPLVHSVRSSIAQVWSDGYGGLAASNSKVGRLKLDEGFEEYNIFMSGISSVRCLPDLPEQPPRISLDL